MEAESLKTLLEALGIGVGGTGGVGGTIIAWKLLTRKNSAGEKAQYVDERLCASRHETVEAELRGVNTRLALVLPQLEALPKRRGD
ncbi:hypothetical protein LCGC14_0959780 [marine sediment metagenome]|uniref:Uncharacterized protein n=1 Tax=marine sediment metagenome TaxID=412755 RepID=A0A0F9P0Y5_9ZZZZ